MRPLAFDRAAFLKECVPDVANGGSEEIAPLILRPKQYQIDEALAHLCNQIGQIDLVISGNVNMLSHELINLAVQTTFLCHNEPRPCLSQPTGYATRPI
jgi:hypothetical protein